MEKENWLAEKKTMEAKFSNDLSARDQNLASRENEHQRRIDDINATHDAAMRQFRADHESAMNARLADHHTAQARFDAELLA